MSFPRLLIAVAILSGASLAFADEPLDLEALEQKKQADLISDMSRRGSHASVAEVKVLGTDGKTKLQTICADSEGRVLALVAPPRGFSQTVKDASSEVRVYSADGKPLTQWAVPFHAHSINVGPDGHVYVAGDGKVVQFDKAGKAVGEVVALPHVADMLKNEAALRKRAEEQLKQVADQFAQTEQIRKQFEERVKTLEAKPEAERTKSEKRQLDQAKQLLEQLGQNPPKPTVESIMSGLSARLRIINAIAISENDVFVACGEVESYGYGIWRLSRDLKNPKKIVGGLSGCCGQMDIQVFGKEVLVAENGQHRFARYDREGQQLGAYGKRASNAGNDAEGFGGCCNPMNVCTMSAGGDVLTAESEGVVKRFSAAGEFRGVVGAVPIKGECKNVAIGASPDGKHVYFCDQPSSRFFVLDRKAEEKKG